MTQMTNVTLTFRVEWVDKDQYKHNLAAELREMADIIEQKPPYDKEKEQ